MNKLIKMPRKWKDTDVCKDCGGITTVKEAGKSHKNCPLKKETKNKTESGFCWNCDEPDEEGYHKAWCFEG